MSEFRVELRAGGDGTASLHWGEQLVDAATLQKAISLAADDGILGHNLRRITAEVPASDRWARMALHHAGFRREGTLRERIAHPDGRYEDALLYARLAADVVNGPVGFSSIMDSVLPTKRVIAHALFRNLGGEVLLLETNYKPDWELPGGVVEPGEPPRLGAEREILEEIGLKVKVGEPALVDWMPPYLGWSDAVEFIFDGGVLDDHQVSSIGVADGEIRHLHWVTRDDVANHVTELSARRILKILDGHTGHTENGF